MKPPLKILDTFAGIGGFSYAAEKIIGGFETTQFIEIEPYCQKVLKKHWPEVPIHDDIKTFTARPFQFDVITGGFPCQDISTAGRGKGITQETRSGLFYELIRVIRMVRPKFVILENVAAILNNGMDIVLGELSEAGYDAEWAVISASSLGACHQRSRWWLVAYPNDNGSSSSEKFRSIKKTDGGVEERKNETSQSQGGSESRNTETVQLNATDSDSLQRLDILRQQPKQRQEKQQRTSNKNNRSRDAANTNSDGYQGQCFETRNKITPGQDPSSKWSTNTSDFERQSDDGNDQRESRTDENLSGSSDGRKTISTTTREICDLSKGTNNDQRISSQNNNQKNNDRALVQKGQSGLQLSKHKELGRNKTTSKGDTIQQRNDNSSEQRMDNQKSNVANTQSKGLQRTSEGGISRERLWSDPTRYNQTTSDTISQRTQIQHEQRGSSVWNLPSSYGKKGSTLNPNWQAYESEPCLRRGDDGLSNWTHRLRALGNSVVPQVAAIPLQRVHHLYYK